MPDTETVGIGKGTLEAVVIRADGTVEDLGVIASSEPGNDESDKEE